MKAISNKKSKVIEYLKGAGYKTMTEIDSILGDYLNNFDGQKKVATRDSEDEQEEEDKIDGLNDYKYLLKMNFFSLTEENMKRLESEKE